MNDTFIRLLVPADKRDEARQLTPGQVVRIMGASAEFADTENKATVIVLGPFAEMLGLPSEEQNT